MNSSKRWMIVLFLYLASFSFFGLFLPLAVADCFVRNACNVGENGLFFVSSLENAHISNVSDPGYMRLCCQNFSLPAGGPPSVLLHMDNLSNAHVEILSAANYNISYHIKETIYNQNGPCLTLPGHECILTLSDVINAHVTACNTSTAYNLHVCGITGTIGPGTAQVNMSCGNVSIGGVKGIDPACNSSNATARFGALCTGGSSNVCVYANETDGSNAACYVLGTVMNNSNRFEIQCSVNNTWCPSNLVYNDRTGFCNIPDVLCNFGYLNWTFGPPNALCLNISSMLVNPGVCFYNFTPPPEYPYNVSCCKNYTWTNQSKLFGFYMPLKVRVI